MNESSLLQRYHLLHNSRPIISTELPRLNRVSGPVAAYTFTMKILEKNVNLKRIRRLTIAPIKGFFTWKTRTTPVPRFDPKHTTLWAYIKAVAHRDAILFFEPFIFAVNEFKQERAKRY